MSSTSTNNNNDQGAPVVSVFSASDNDSRVFASALVQLSSNTEMDSYGLEQWEFLLKAGNVSALVVAAAAAPDNQQSRSDNQDLLGSVLRVVYGSHVAYGMMLVSPKARGQGLARRLLEAAMDMPLTDTSTSSTDTNASSMKILGTCTEMGRPFYKKVGFERVSTVTRMTVECKGLNLSPPPNDPQLDIQIEDGAASAGWKEILALDRKATGLDRSQTLAAINSYPYVSTVTITRRRQEDDNSDGDDQDTLVMAAMVTRHTNSTTAMVGPILGEERYVAFLLQAIRDKNNCNNSDTNELALIVSDHESLVQALTDAGFKSSFQLGAMTMGGQPMPGERDLYLGLIHPTLG